MNKPRQSKLIEITRILGPMYGVKYPSRKTTDLYLAMDGKPVFCAQCEAEFGIKKFIDHIRGHARTKQDKEAGITLVLPLAEVEKR